MMHKLELLKWQVAMGADEAIAREPQDAFAMKSPALAAPTTAPREKTEAQSPAAKKTAAPTATPNAAVRTTPPHKAILEARTLADACTTLADLEAAVRNFDGCALKRTATKTVFADGNPKSDLMLIGEAPGAQEDEEGIPFCGQSGQLLDLMLSYADFTRPKNFYITNTLFWRPPGNRKPTPEEIAICQPFVEKHIALIAPKMLVLVGSTAITALLDSKIGITKLRGKFYTYTNRYMDVALPVGVMFHPSYLLRSPGQKRLAWQDILSIKQKLATLAGH